MRIDSNFHSARPVHQIILMIKWTRNSRLSIKESGSALLRWGLTLQIKVHAPKRRHKKEIVAEKRAKSKVA